MALTAKQRAELVNRFSRMDLDHNGEVTHEDFKKTLGDGFTDEDVDAFIAEADVNGDGKFNLQEYLSASGDSENMSQEDLVKFVEEKINAFAQRMINKGNSTDEVAVGELLFYTTLRSALSGKVGKKELGLLDAINDTLQYLGKVKNGTTFYK